MFQWTFFVPHIFILQFCGFRLVENNFSVKLKTQAEQFKQTAYNIQKIKFFIVNFLSFCLYTFLLFLYRSQLIELSQDDLHWDRKWARLRQWWSISLNFGKLFAKIVWGNGYTTGWNFYSHIYKKNIQKYIKLRLKFRERFQ